MMKEEREERKRIRKETRSVGEGEMIEEVQ